MLRGNLQERGENHVLSASGDWNPTIQTVNALLQQAGNGGKRFTRPLYIQASSDADYSQGAVLAFSLQANNDVLRATVKAPKTDTLTYCVSDRAAVKEEAVNVVRIIGTEYPVLLNVAESSADQPDIDTECGINSDDDTFLHKDGKGFICLSSPITTPGLDKPQCWALQLPGTGSEPILVKTDEIVGIPKREGTLPGSNSDVVKVVRNANTGNLETEGDPFTVYNWSAKPVSENVYGLVVKIGGLWWIINADCHPDIDDEL